jgi:hypothetical protein
MVYDSSAKDYDLTAIDIRREITALRKSRDFSKGCVSPKRLFIFW